MNNVIDASLVILEAFLLVGSSCTDESDDEDEPPSRRRRMAERAAEDGEGGDEEVGCLLRLMLNRIFILHFDGKELNLTLFGLMALMTLLYFR